MQSLPSTVHAMATKHWLPYVPPPRQQVVGHCTLERVCRSHNSSEQGPAHEGEAIRVLLTILVFKICVCRKFHRVLLR